MKKAVSVAITVLGTLFFVIGIPLIINASYQCDTTIIITQWGAEDVLNYYGAVLGSFVTIAGLAITIWFTKKQIHRENYLKVESDKWAKTETVVSDILNEINLMPTLKQVMDTGFTDPAKAINSLQKYQISCRTAADQLIAYLNVVDYPKVEELINHIASVAEKFFQVSKQEIDQYSKQQELKRREITLELLSMEKKRPGSLSAEEIVKHQETIKNTDSIRFEDIEKAIQQINEEIIRIYETDFRGLLQLKGATFEAISVQTQKDADAILSLRRK